MHFIWLSMYLARKLQTRDTIFRSPTGDRTAILRGRPNHVKIKPLQGKGNTLNIKSSIKPPPPSQISPFPLLSAPLQEKKVNKAPLPSPSYS